MRLNQNPLKEISFNNFGGGYAGAKGVGSLNNKEALDLDNIVILPSGGGIRNRQGNREESHSGNLSTIVNPVQGIISFKQPSAEYLIWATTIGGNTSVFSHDITTSTHTIRKTLTAAGTGQNNIFSFFKFKSLVIGVSDSQTTPLKIDMSGTPSGGDLGGTPPSGKVGISWNNRAWIGNTSSDPSKLYYSVLDDPEDWSSTGSGFVNPQQKDGDELIAVVPISNNVLLFFKRHSTFQVVGRSDPFSVYPLFRNVGCAGKNAFVEADGLVHFVTAEGKMRITDGNRIYDDKEIPALSNADDLWAAIPKTRLPYIQGYRHIGVDFDHIVFLVSYGATQTSNNFAIIWDFKNKCWIKNSKGYNGNCVTTLNDGTVYIGGYAGRLYKQDTSGKYTDDSESTPVIDGSNLQVLPTNPPLIRWFWRSDDLSLNSLENIVQVDRANVLAQYQNTGSLKLSFGYDGYHDSSSIIKTVVPATFILASSILGVDILGGVKFSTETIRPLGRGQTFNLKIEGFDTVGSEITKYSISGRQAATKVKEVR